jgi:hypothetical protein
LLLALLAAPVSSAETDTPAQSAASAQKNPPPQPLRPKTRYTVREQIENIRPTAWLQSYGQVRVRKVGR